MARRVFIGLTEVAGYFGNLQDGFSQIGVAATFVDESGHPFGYRRAGLLGRLGRATRGLAARAAAARGPRRHAWRVLWTAAYAAQQPMRALLFARAVARHDAFVFSTDTWLPRNLDLPLLRVLGKRIVWTFTGTDHRPPYLDGGVATALSGEPARLAAVTRKVRRRVAMAERYAHEIVALPASAHFHTRPVVDFLRIGIPFAIPDDDPGLNPFTGRGVRILHGPSTRVGKGSDRIRAAVEDLGRAGHAIDYHEISGRPHREVLAALAHCDFVVDEVFSDTPMAGFATEAAAFGKPAVVTGYYADLVADQLAPGERPPSLFEHPDRLAAAIERLVSDERFRTDLGARAAAFVRESWSPTAVARRYLRLIDGDVPEDWRWDPARQRYLDGWGMPHELVIDTVRELVGAGGADALELDHRPALLGRFLELVAERPAGG